MNFKTNFNELSLMGNIPIEIKFDSKIVKFVPPSLTLTMLNNDFSEFYGTLKQDISTLNSLIKEIQVEISTRYGMLKLLLLLEGKKKTSNFNYILKLLYPNVEIINNSLVFDGVEISEEEFDLLFDFLLISCGEKPMKDIQTTLDSGNRDSKEIEKNKRLEEFERKRKETQEKINAVKNKKNQDVKPEEKEVKKTLITIDQIVIAILYEFPSFTIDRIYEMNLFTVLKLWEYISKVVDNQIQIVAAGNGNIKKFTYFIN